MFQLKHTDNVEEFKFELPADDVIMGVTPADQSAALLQITLSVLAHRFFFFELLTQHLHKCSLEIF